MENETSAVAAAALGQTDHPPIWVRTDGRPGTANQALAVADALGLPFDTIELGYGPLARLPNWLLGHSLAGLSAASRDLLRPPWPDLIVAAGRRAGRAALAIKSLSNGQTRVAQIMNPGRWRRDRFDLVAIPNHDAVGEASNILKITGAPHRINGTTLQAAADSWRETFAQIPSPIIGLIVGGPAKGNTFDGGAALELGRRAARFAGQKGGSLVVTTSRRTGDLADSVLQGLADEGAAPALTYKWGETGENPYLGILALADEIIATGDSVSMCCEACAAAAPVRLFAPPGLVGEKHQRFLQELFDAGMAQPLDATPDATFEAGSPAAGQAPLDEAQRVAAEVRRLLAKDAS